MGDPKKKKKRYMTPTHPWQKDRIDDEKELKRKYGLKNKKEIWKAQSLLRNMRGQARTLLGTHTQQAEKETEDLLGRLKRLSILKEEAELDDVLALTIQDVLDRRLQSVVVRKGLALNMRQARQMISHGHVVVDSRRVSIPSYMVSALEEETVAYSPSSPFVGRELRQQRTMEVPEAPAEEAPVKEGEQHGE
ncbi:MAG TPA: 30S ribosomal protein S4 [Methanomicrobia archaeon]|mgnify:CR=1 FL=1|nr:30S ribosomal protein S4 [Methanomicrobia archaeon]